MDRGSVELCWLVNQIALMCGRRSRGRRCSGSCPSLTVIKSPKMSEKPSTATLRYVTGGDRGDRTGAEGVPQPGRVAHW